MGLFNKLKKYALNKSKLNPHRWYEYYVVIEPREISNFYDITPKIYFKEKTLFNALNNILDSKRNRRSLNFLSSIIAEIEK